MIPDVKSTDIQQFDLTFDLSVMSYLVPLTIGASVFPVPHTGIRYMDVYSILEDKQITFALMVPSVIACLQPYFGDIDLPALRYSLFCGEALNEEVTKQWSACNAAILNVYGPTENTFTYILVNHVNH
jgi:non-ribosomal peptide synthetase component F